jgi:hypothetical protein
MAHGCNPNYSGGRDQENHGQELTPGKNVDPTWKITKTKQGWGNDSSGREPA